jgi:CxxC motif-containing protein
MTVSGNNCPRGAQYGISELTAPVRTLTSTVKIDGAICRRCPVRSSADVPREKVADIMKLLDTVELNAPVKLGDVIFENVLDTGADIIVTRNLNKI